jgi:hypothetical protein
MATDSTRVLAVAERPDDDRECHGDTLVWFWQEGLAVQFLDAYRVQSYMSPGHKEKDD